MNTITEHITAIERRIAEIEKQIDRVSGVSTRRPAVSVRPSFQAMVTQRMTAQATPEALSPIIDEAAAQYQVRPELLNALIQAESNYNTQAVSPRGAQGLTQLMPGTASSLGVDNPFDARQNIFGGARYLRQQLDQFGGDERMALAAYNAGPGAVRRYGGIPPYPETRQYVTRIMSLAGERE